jgi:cytochrome c oxidase assembly protein subunit 15
MDLAEFKAIYWLEYLHRLWGRLIGVVFLAPFLYFLARVRIGRALGMRLAVVFCLGALQGVLGWYMVKSGLIDRPDVSQYRLTAHLGLALLLYGYMFWVALGLVAPRAAAAQRRRPSLALCGLILLIYCTALSGGLVAGLDAGFVYNNFPLMGGRLIPDGLWDLDPTLRNLFENITTVQFTHRLLALSTLAATLALWRWCLASGSTRRARRAAHGLAAAALLQVTLGVSTLLLAVPLPLALAHQGGAVLLLTAALWALHESRVPASQPGYSGSSLEVEREADERATRHTVDGRRGAREKGDKVVRMKWKRN